MSVALVIGCVWLAAAVFNLIVLILVFNAVLKSSPAKNNKTSRENAVKNIRLYFLLGPIGTVMLVVGLILVLLDELIGLVIKNEG